MLCAAETDPFAAAFGPLYRVVGIGHQLAATVASGIVTGLFRIATAKTTRSSVEEEQNCNNNVKEEEEERRRGSSNGTLSSVREFTKKDII